MRRTRALIVTLTGYWTGGIVAYLNSLVPALVENGVDPTVLTCETMDPAHAERLRSLGVGSIELNACLDSQRRPIAERPLLKRRLIDGLREVLERGRYDAIHVNTSAPWLQAMTCHAAMDAGVPVRIAHCHSDLGEEGVRQRLTHTYHLLRILRIATHLVACSNEAGRFLFGNRAWERRGIFIKNGIDTVRFAFRKDVRERLRSGCPDALVIGNVGYLSREKNQSLLVEAFAEVHRAFPNALLWLVGSGSDERLLADLAKRRGVGDSVVFWGARDDVPDLLQAMDCFVLTSVREGLPVSLIEAQAAGLPCVVPEEIVPVEACIPGCRTECLSLAAPADEWARRIISLAGHRVEHADALVRDAGFDSAECGAAMARLYRGEG